MTQAEMQITMAYHQMLTHMKDMYESFLKDAQANPESHEGVTKDDAVIWFIEGF